MERVSTIRLESVPGVRLAVYQTKLGISIYFVENFDPLHRKPFYSIADAIRYALAVVEKKVVPPLGFSF